jgi:NAD(P)-dependent dehydrogenase (short-subunit alcohol dehydrogenase family)
VWSEELARFGVRTIAIAPIARTRITNAAFGELPTEGGFDVLAPENVAPLAVYLASDLSNHWSGEVFSIHGGDVDRQQPWQPGKSLNKDGRWTIAELCKALA